MNGDVRTEIPARVGLCHRLGRKFSLRRIFTTVVRWCFPETRKGEKKAGMSPLAGEGGFEPP